MNTNETPSTFQQESSGRESHTCYRNPPSHKSSWGQLLNRNVPLKQCTQKTQAHHLASSENLPLKTGLTVSAVLYLVIMLLLSIIWKHTHRTCSSADGHLPLEDRTLWSASPPKEDRPGRHCNLSLWKWRSDARAHAPSLPTLWQQKEGRSLLKLSN